MPSGWGSNLSRGKQLRMGKKGGPPKKSKKQLEEEALQALEDARKEANAAKIREMANRMTADAQIRASLDREGEEAKEEAMRLEYESGMVEYGKSKRWTVLTKIRQAERERVEWEEFAACSGRPNIRREADIVTYEQWLEADAEEGRLFSVSQYKPGLGRANNEGSTPFTVAPLSPAASATSVPAVLAGYPQCSIERALAVVYFTQFLVEDLHQGYIRALADGDAKKMAWCLGHVEKIRTTVLSRHLDYATGHLFQFIEDLGVSSSHETQATWGQLTDDVFLAFWAFLQPKGFRAKLMDLPQFKMTIELPKSVASSNLGHCLGARVLYTRFDSSYCFAETVLKSRKGHYGRAAIATPDDTGEDESKQSGGEGWIRRDLMGRQPTEPGFGRASLPPRYAIGGVVHVDVVSIPQLRAREKGWLIRTLPSSDGPNYTRLPYPSPTGRDTPQPCRVEFRLPDDVVVDQPEVAWRDMESQSWSDEGIGEVEWDPSTRKVNFSAALLAPFAVTVLRSAHFPYQQWRIAILPDAKESTGDEKRALLTVVTALGLEVRVEIRPAGVHLVAPERDELRHLRTDENGHGIFWSSAVLLTKLRDAGINLMPVDEDAQWLLKPRDVKDSAVELLACNDIAELVLMGHDVAGSQHNNALECGKDRVVLRARPNPNALDLDGDDDEKHKEYKVAMVWPDKCALISAVEGSDFDETLKAPTHYSLTIALTGSTATTPDPTDADSVNGSSPSSSSKPLTKAGDVLTMGRIPDCDIVFKSNAISGNHCSLAYLDGGVVRLTDTSFNGTYVNGELVGKGKTADIKSGDRIGLGRPMVNTKATRQGQKAVSFLVEYTAKFVDPPGVSTAPSPSRLRASSAPILEDNKKDPLTTKAARPLSAVVPGQESGLLRSGLEGNTSMKTPQQYPAVRHIKTEPSRAGAAPARPAVAPQAMASNTRIDGDKRRVSTQQPSKDVVVVGQASQTTAQRGDVKTEPAPTSAKSKERPRRQQQQQPSSTRSLVGDSDNRRSFGLSRKDSNGKASAVPPDSALPSSGSCWLCPKRKEREESLVTETKALRARLASREGELATLEERLQESELTMTLKKRKLTSTEQKLKDAQTEVMSTKEALSSLQEAHAELKARCEGLVNAAKKSKTDREALVEKLNAVEARANSTESELIYCQEQAHGLQQNLDQECEHSRSLSAELQHSREHCGALKADLQEALGKLQRVLNDRASLQSEVGRLHGDLDKAKAISSSEVEVARALAGAIRDGLKAFEGHSFLDLPATRASLELSDISPVKLRSTELVSTDSTRYEGTDVTVRSMTQEVVSELAQSLPHTATQGRMLHARPAMPTTAEGGQLGSMTQCSAIAQRDNSTSSIDGVSLGSAASDGISADQREAVEGSVARAMDTQEQLEGVGGTQMMWTEEADALEEDSKEAQLPATAGMLQPTADVPQQEAALDDDEFADFPEDIPSLGQENRGTFDDLAEFDIDALPGRSGGSGQVEEGAFSDDFADFDLSQHPARMAAERVCNDSLLADLDLEDTFSSLSADKPRRPAAHQAQTDGLNGAVDELADFDDF
ncbi:Cancer susceptibility candidate 1 [Perkinsus olseni]|uniref:Cancer susceptibility candidate 1 n=1 Tax=Perkinsus olseni TaxID=32597 RepID=A0A7J6MP65_PEROL|nr:Cancer susceptibility candidate 1 [Perkinsus olseni]